MNSTQTYWDINGVSLQNLAWNIKTWGGNLQAPPPSRGEDLVISGASGQRAMRRVPDARQLTFSMWVVGAKADGTPPDDGEVRLFFERNWRQLRKLFWNEAREFVLTRRWIDDNGVLHNASAIARYDSGLDLSMTGEMRAEFSVDVLLAQPFFVESRISVDLPITLVASAISVDNPGDYSTNRIKLSVTGPTPAGLELAIGTAKIKIDSAIASNRRLEIDVHKKTAYLLDSTTNVYAGNLIGGISFYGNWDWAELPTGRSRFSYDLASSTGSINLAFSPVYL